MYYLKAATCSENIDKTDSTDCCCLAYFISSKLYIIMQLPTIHKRHHNLTLSPT